MKRRLYLAVIISLATIVSACELAKIAQSPSNSTLPETIAFGIVVEEISIGPTQVFIDDTDIESSKLENVENIVLLDIPEPIEYGDALMEVHGFSFGSTAQATAKKSLEESGFNVSELAVNRERKHRLLPVVDYFNLMTDHADAYLDIAPVFIGYKSDPDRKDVVGPNISVAFRLIAAGTKEVIYAGSIQYGVGKDLEAPGIKFDSPVEHRYELPNELTIDKAEAIEHLEYGVQFVSSAISRNIKQGQFLDTAVEEINNGSLDRALWDEALVKSDCDETKRKAKYLELRTIQLSSRGTQPYQAITLTSDTNPADELAGDESNRSGNITGIYVSEITTNSNWVFKKRIHREIKVDFKQIGNCVTGENGRVNLKISGVRNGDTVSFYTWPSDITSDEIRGNWKIFDHGQKLIGKWSHPHGNGDWNLTRIE
jgi:hypothetical protein